MKEKSFQKVKKHLFELNYNIVFENENDGIFIISDEENGISNLVLGCADPLLIMELSLHKFDLPSDVRGNIKEYASDTLEDHSTAKLVHLLVCRS